MIISNKKTLLFCLAAASMLAGCEKPEQEPGPCIEPFDTVNWDWVWKNNQKPDSTKTALYSEHVLNNQR